MTSNPIPETPTPTLPPDLKAGSKEDASELRELEGGLATTLKAARFFGTEENTLGAQNTDWHGQWDDIGRILLRIRAGIDTMTAFVEGNETGNETHALEAWDMIQSEDARLVLALKNVRTQVGQLGLSQRKEWNVLARALGLQLEAIHDCAQSLRLKLEELRERSQGAPVEGGPESPHDRDYRRAALQLEREQHIFSGIKDVVKGLWMWSETPDERMRENRSLVVDES